MLKLHTLPGDPGKTQPKKRVGRGESSGQGRTSGHGNKGKQARSGSGKGAGFEGGQMPMVRRMPKFGFSNERFAVQHAAVTLTHLEKFESGATVDMEALRSMRLIAKRVERVKVIATGKLTKKLTVRLHQFSAGAKQSIEQAGGTCEPLES